MPLSPLVGVMFTTNVEKDEVLAPWMAQRMNWNVWRAAHIQVACHPSTDLHRALARTAAAAS